MGVCALQPAFVSRPGVAGTCPYGREAHPGSCTPAPCRNAAAMHGRDHAALSGAAPTSSDPAAADPCRPCLAAVASPATDAAAGSSPWGACSPQCGRSRRLCYTRTSGWAVLALTLCAISLPPWRLPLHGMVCDPSFHPWPRLLQTQLAAHCPPHPAPPEPSWVSVWQLAAVEPMHAPLLQLCT